MNTIEMARLAEELANAAVSNDVDKLRSVAKTSAVAFWRMCGELDESRRLADTRLLHLKKYSEMYREAHGLDPDPPHMIEEQQTDNNWNKKNENNVRIDRHEGSTSQDACEG